VAAGGFAVRDLGYSFNHSGRNARIADETCRHGSRPTNRCAMTRMETLLTGRTRALLIVGIAIALMVPAMAFASHTFNDVPDDNVFHDDISWLADAGVTLGCNPPTNDLFCPTDNVSRGQMAAFLRRFSDHLDVEGLADLVELKANSADVYTKADVDAAVASSSAAGYTSSDIGEGLTAAASTLLSLAIDTPADGVLIVDGMVNMVAAGTAAGASVVCWIGLDSTTETGAHGVQDLSGAVQDWTDSRGFDVTAGSHTLTLSCRQDNYSSPANAASIQLRNLTAIFSANEL
jgi:hypothetical protein